MDRYGPGGEGMSGEAVGAAMRLARRRLGLSQRALADALGWDRAKVGRWERGQVPEGFDEVVAIVGLLGFTMVLTDPAADRWVEWDEPVERVLDRADRRFPAHLELCAEKTSSTWNWTRHRGEPSPKAGGMSFERETPGRRRAEMQRDHDAAAHRKGGTGSGEGVPPPGPEAS